MDGHHLEGHVASGCDQIWVRISHVHAHSLVLPPHTPFPPYSSSSMYSMSSSSGNKKKGKEKAKSSANVLEIVDLNELSITSSESIKFSCYETSEKVGWFLDSGCTDHMTPRKSDFVQYRELGQAHSAEIADRKYIPRIEGYGTIIGHSIMLNEMASLQI